MEGAFYLGTLDQYDTICQRDLQSVGRDRRQRGVSIASSDDNPFPRPPWTIATPSSNAVAKNLILASRSQSEETAPAHALSAAMAQPAAIART